MIHCADYMDLENQASKTQRLILLKTRRLTLRAQRIASVVCSRLPTKRLERVWKVLRFVQNSQKAAPGSPHEHPLFFQNLDEQTIKMPSRHPYPKPGPRMTDVEARNVKQVEPESAGKGDLFQPESKGHSAKPNQVRLKIRGSRNTSNKDRKTRPPSIVRRLVSQNPPPLFTSCVPEPSLKSPPTAPIPSPSSIYTAACLRPLQRLSSPQPLLLVLDLNGTLVYRKKGSSTGLPRPSVQKFLNHCLTHHRILIWSSARPENVQPICRTLFSPPSRYKKLVGVWGRDTFGLSNAQYLDKVQVYKNLDVIWQNETVQASHPDYEDGGKWNQANTLLLDDSQEKARAQPHNLIRVPEFLKQAGEEEGQQVLAQVLGWIEEARWYYDVSCVGRTNPFTINAGWQWDWERGAAPPKPAVVHEAPITKSTSENPDVSSDLDEEDGGIALGISQLGIH